MMKYDTDNPRPVPTPTGLVVKNGSVAKNSESILKVFPQTQIPGRC